MNYACLITSGT